MSDDGIRNAYARMGVERFYQAHGATYRNPHEDAVIAGIGHCFETWSLDFEHTLDLACGSGEVTLAIMARQDDVQVDGVDPYTGEAYTERTGQPCHSLSFADIAMHGFDAHYSVIVCSYALHLCPKSRLPGLLWQLSQASDTLVVITPHKKPEIKPQTGWILHDEVRLDGTRTRWYQTV